MDSFYKIASFVPYLGFFVIYIIQINYQIGRIIRLVRFKIKKEINQKEKKWKTSGIFKIKLKLENKKLRRLITILRIFNKWTN